MIKVRNNSSLNTIYGCPYNADMTLNAAWRKDNIVSMTPPYKMWLAWATDTEVTEILVNRAALPNFQKAFNNVVAKATQLAKQQFTTAAAILHEAHLDLFGGSFNFRAQRGSAVISYHAYGAAIDIAPTQNEQGQKPTIPLWFVQCWTSAGFTWGGTFHGSRVDGMHFELHKPS